MLDDLLAEDDSRMSEASASAMAMSPEELLMEEVSALDTAGAAKGEETVSNNIMHGCDLEVVTTPN
jgi:ABC-type phosphate transport system ATPase subunit